MKAKIISKLKKLINILPLVFYIGIGIVSGIFISEFLDSKLLISVSLVNYLLLLLVMLVIMYVSIVIQIIIHKAGHLIFGLISGYSFTSFRLLNIMLIKINGKLRIKFFSINGTVGQCIMVPPKFINNTIPYALYNFGGSILNLIASALFTCLYFILRNTMQLPIIFIILAVTGAALGIMNGIPLKFSEVDNDGVNFLSLYKSDEAVKSFYIQLKVNQKLASGMRLKDMPNKWFYIPENRHLDNSLTAVMAVFYANRLFDEHQFEKSEIIIDKLLTEKNAVLSINKYFLVCDKIFCMLLKNQEPQKIKALLSLEQKKFMKKMKNYPLVIRTEYAVNLLLNDDREAADKALKRFHRVAKHYPYSADIEAEKELIEIVTNK